MLSNSFCLELHQKASILIEDLCNLLKTASEVHKRIRMSSLHVLRHMCNYKINILPFFNYDSARRDGSLPLWTPYSYSHVSLFPFINIFLYVFFILNVNEKQIHTYAHRLSTNTCSNLILKLKSGWIWLFAIFDRHRSNYKNPFGDFLMKGPLNTCNPFSFFAWSSFSGCWWHIFFYCNGSFRSTLELSGKLLPR